MIKIALKCLGGTLAKTWPDLAAIDTTTIRSSDKLQQLAGQADVIVAVDWMSGQHQIVYGLQTMKDVASGEAPRRGVYMVAFVLDFDTQWLEAFSAFVICKGCFEWNGEIHTPDT